jgi:ABC-2 type transport system permease protein
MAAPLKHLNLAMPTDQLLHRVATTAHPTRSVVTWLTAKKATRSGLIWGYIFGAAIASSAYSYTKLYQTQSSRAALATAYESNKATAALFGPAPQLQTVAGFTAFKISMTLMILGAVWGLLLSTRLLRGEEDEGRWAMLLTGQTNRKSATAQALTGLFVGAAILWALASTITVITGLDASIAITPLSALYFATAMVATPAMFIALGALTSQLAATRRQAAAYAAVALGVFYAIRMLADAGVGLHGLIWLSPLGWVEQLRPLTAPHPLALLPIAAFTVAMATLAVRLAGRRDVGASFFTEHATPKPHPRLLYGPTGLTIRLVRPTVIGWWVAIAFAGLLYGLIAKSAGSTIAGSSVHNVLSKLGATGTGTEAVLGVCFLIFAVMVAFVAAGQLTSLRTEESSSHLDCLLAQPVSRTHWLTGRLLVTVAVLVVSGQVAGLFAYLGAASQHSGVGLVTLLIAGVNLVPPAICILGIGVLTYGLAPRATSTVVYGYLGWSLFVVIIGSIGAISHKVLDTSVFHQMTSAPATAPNWTANAVLVLLGVLSALFGLQAFKRRDVQGP